MALVLTPAVEGVDAGLPGRKCEIKKSATYLIGWQQHIPLIFQLGQRTW